MADIDPRELYERILDGREAHGGLGYLPGTVDYGIDAETGDPSVDLAHLPEHIRRNYELRMVGGENAGAERMVWQLFGGYAVDREGQAVVQITPQRNLYGDDRGDGRVLDWENVWYDPELGMVTKPDNLYAAPTDWADIALNAAMIWGGGYLFGGAMDAATGAAAGGAGAAGGGSTALGGDALAGTEIVNTYAPGVDPTQFYQPLGAGVAPTVPTTPPTAPPSGPPPTTPPAGPPNTGAPPTQPPAPVTNATTPPPPSPGSGGGVLDTVRNAGNSAMSWYDGLSPGSRFLLGTAVSQGLGAMNSANAQRRAQREADERERRFREDRVRRGAVPAFGGAFTPKPDPVFDPRTGIINSRRGGG